MIMELTVYKCKMCGKVYYNKVVAEECCKGKEKPKNKCRVCVCEVEPPWTICRSCREKERYDKAIKIPYAEYKIPMLYDERTEKFFSDPEELEEEYFDNLEDEVPAWCYGCVEIPFKIDIDNAIESASEKMHEDFDYERDVMSLKELHEFIKQWNAKQTAKTYEVDYKTVVLLG